MDLTSLTMMKKPEAYTHGWASFFDGFNEHDVEKFYPLHSPSAELWIKGLRDALKANNPKEFNPNFINCRRIENMIAHPWEPIVDIYPPTITQLIAFLQLSNIDPAGLSVDTDANPRGQTLKYGANQQFWLPDEATEEELKLLNSWKLIPKNIHCPICETKIGMKSKIDNGQEIYYAVCQICDIEITKHSSPALSPAMLTRLITREI